MVIAYLMQKLGKSRDELLAEMKIKWPRARPSSTFMAQLEIWEDVAYDVWADEVKTVPKPEYAAYLERIGLTGERGKRIIDRKSVV